MTDKLSLDETVDLANKVTDWMPKSYDHQNRSFTGMVGPIGIDLCEDPHEAGDKHVVQIIVWGGCHTLANYEAFNSERVRRIYDLARQQALQKHTKEGYLKIARTLVGTPSS